MTCSLINIYDTRMKEVNEEKKENGSKGEEQLAEDYNLKDPANSFRGLDSIEKSIVSAFNWY